MPPNYLEKPSELPPNYFSHSVFYPILRISLAASLLLFLNFRYFLFLFLCSSLYLLLFFRLILFTFRSLASVFLPLCHSLHVSLLLSVFLYLFFCFSLSLPLSIFLSVFVCRWLSISPSPFSLILWFHASLSLFPFLSLYPSHSVSRFLSLFLAFSVSVNCPSLLLMCSFLSQSLSFIFFRISLALFLFFCIFIFFLKFSVLPFSVIIFFVHASFPFFLN